MRLSRCVSFISVLFLALPSTTLMPVSALACGGFFCNALTETPILQASERIVFARHDDQVTMHVEVAYDGDPTQFGWILPLPERPRDSAGEFLPLDKTVGISSPYLFDVLQAATNPAYGVQLGVDYVTDSCNMFAGSANEMADGVPTSAGVMVLEEAKVGPYDAQLIEATSSEALYDWLNDNGYLQDEAARPLLSHYVGQGYVFVGIRLQSGKRTDALRPLSLTLGEQAPCVPLRLTPTTDHAPH